MLKSLLLIQLNTKTCSARNTPLEKKSDICTATEISGVITDFTDLLAAATPSLKTTQAATTLAAQQPASKLIS